MANTVTIDNIDAGSQSIYVLFTVALSGTYVNGTGEVLNLLTATQNADFLGQANWLPVAGVCLNIDIWSVGNSQFRYGYQGGGKGASTPANLKLRVTDSNVAPVAELANGAYPAAVTGDLIIGMAVFNKLI